MLQLLIWNDINELFGIKSTHSKYVCRYVCKFCSLQMKVLPVVGTTQTERALHWLSFCCIPPQFHFKCGHCALMDQGGVAQSCLHVCTFVVYSVRVIVSMNTWPHVLCRSTGTFALYGWPTPQTISIFLHIWLSVRQKKDIHCPTHCCVITWTCFFPLWRSFVLSAKIGAPRFLSQIPYTSISCAQPEWTLEKSSIYFLHQWHWTE